MAQVFVVQGLGLGDDEDEWVNLHAWSTQKQADDDINWRKEQDLAGQDPDDDDPYVQQYQVEELDLD